MPDFINVRTALEQGQKLLEAARVPSAKLTAEVLFMHATGQNRAWLYAHALDPLKELHRIHYGRYLNERINGKPTQYITGRQEFYGHEFRVTNDVLIPRPETEHVVEAALARINRGSRVLEIGAGSGCIAITLALESNAAIYAGDLSAAALEVCSANARWLQANVEWLSCDLGSAFADESFDAIVSNPPYVALRDKSTLQTEVREHEPALALFAGDDGNDVYRRLIPESERLLKPGGWLVLELGDADFVRSALSHWDDVEISNDLAGIPRVAVARKHL